MPERKIDFKRLAADLLARSDSLVPDWLPNGRRDGHEWRCGNVRGDAGKSLAVNLSTGIWADFSSGEKGGDLISLYAAIFTDNDQGRAAKELGAQFEGDAAPIKTTKPTVKASQKRSSWMPIVPAPAHAGEPPVAHSVRGRPSIRWEYCDWAGQTLGYVYRFETSGGGKEVLPCVWAREEGSDKEAWRWMQFPVPRPLYGQPNLSGKPYVLVVEGEKCVDAAQAALGEWFDVVSWPGGGKAVSKADWRPLEGRKVIIWPDCDSKYDNNGVLLPEHSDGTRQGQPGIKAAEDVAAILLDLGCEVRIVAVPAPGTIADGWDVVDALAQGDMTTPDLRNWIYGHLRESIHAKGAQVAPAVQGSTIKPTAASPYWKSQLIKKPRGGYEDCKENVALTLESHPDMQGMVGYNEFSARIEKLKPTPWPSSPGEWTADDDLELSMWLGTTGNVLFKSTGTIGEGVKLVANRNKFHPVREWLDSLAWDGTDRLSSWLTDCLGVVDSAYVRLIGALWLRQAVNRILHPGCKGDYVLILEGIQGLMKSSALHALGGEWFSDAPLDLNSKDAFMSIQGAWIYEIAELDAFNRSEATRIKAFLTQAQDRYRPPYGSRTVTQPRQTVFAATTNSYEYHKDPTGNRRFWSVACTKVNIDLIRECRAQLFAQAVAEVRAGAQVYPTREQETTLIIPEQQMREIVDPWYETVAHWLEEPENALVDRFTSAQILTGAIKMELAKIDGQRSATTRIGNIMMMLGWGKGRESGGHRLRYYARPASQRITRSASPLSVEEDSDLPI